MSAVDVVIPSHDRELTVACVRSLADAGGSGVEVNCVVVDNGSADGTAGAVREADPAATVIRSERNPGFSRSCNQGAAAGSAPYILFLNSDIVARPGAIARLIGHLDSSPEHVAGGGRLVDIGTDRTQVGFNVRGFPTLPRLATYLSGLDRWWPANPISRRTLMLDFDYGRTQDSAQPAGACIACRRVVFDELGGFDEGFYHWFEDVDLCRRLWERGRIAYVHDAVFEHVGGAGFAGWRAAEQVLSWYPGLLRYFDKHGSPGGRVGVRGLVALFVSLRALLFWRLDRERARAYREVVRLALTPRRGGREITATRPGVARR